MIKRFYGILDVLDLSGKDVRFLVPVVLLGILLLGIGFRWGVADSRRLESLFPPGSEALKVEAANIPQGTGWVLPVGGPIFAITERKDILHLYDMHAIWTKHPDEMTIFQTLKIMMRSRSKLYTGETGYGGLYYYSLAALYGSLHLVGAVELTTSRSHYVLHPEDLSRMILVGRAWVGFLFILSAIMLYAVGKRLAGEFTGFTAALVWISLPGSVVWGHELKPHMPMMLFAGLSCYFSMGYLKSGSLRAALLAFAGSALCTSLAKFGGISILFPLLAIFFSESSSMRRAALWKGLLIFFGIFAFLNPSTILHPGDLFGFYRTSLIGQVHAQANMAGIQALSWILDFIPDKLIPAMTAWTLLLALIGMVCAVRLLGRESRVILIPPLLYLIYAAYLTAPFRGAHQQTIARYGIFGYFMLSLFAALAAAALWKRNRLFGGALVGLTLLNQILFSLPHLVNYTLDAGPDATSLQAARWVHENIVEGAEIGGRIDDTLRFPPIQFLNYRLFKMTDEFSPGLYPVPGRLPRHFITVAPPEWFHYRDRYRLLVSFLPREKFFGLNLRRSLSLANEPFYIYKKI